MRYYDLILIICSWIFCSETILITRNKSNIILEGGGRENTILSWKTYGLIKRVINGLACLTRTRLVY